MQINPQSTSVCDSEYSSSTSTFNKLDKIIQTDKYSAEIDKNKINKFSKIQPKISQKSDDDKTVNTNKNAAKTDKNTAKTRKNSDENKTVMLNSQKLIGQLTNLDINNSCKNSAITNKEDEIGLDMDEDQQSTGASSLADVYELREKREPRAATAVFLKEQQALCESTIIKNSITDVMLASSSMDATFEATGMGIEDSALINNDYDNELKKLLKNHGMVRTLANRSPRDFFFIRVLGEGAFSTVKIFFKI